MRHAVVEHEYLSTYCLHEKHYACESTSGVDAVGKRFERNPAQCKVCAAPCTCDCHVITGRYRRDSNPHPPA